MYECKQSGGAGVLSVASRGKEVQLADTGQNEPFFLFCPSGPAKIIRSNKFRGGAVEFFFFFTCFEGNFGI